MAKKLIITEKPSVARDFARVLNVNGNKNGYIENNDYVISWCYGHLVEMVYPEVYDEKYKTWNLDDLPFLPENYKYGVIERCREQYELIHRLLFREDIDVVYWAGDSGKEGQTIEENIRNFGGVREGMEELRVWIDSQTDDEIKRGIKEAKPMSSYDNLGKSGIMRTIEDYSLGINFSRALSVKFGRMINDAAATKSYTAIAIGRVMTCVLGMVVNREREIRNFVETPFYKVNGNFTENEIHGEWKVQENSAYFNSVHLYKENGFKQREYAEELIKELQGKKAVIASMEKGTTRKKAPLLFNLAELQSECSKLFKINPSQTLQVVQELYERKFTTYPRTDARVLTTAIAKQIAGNLNKLKSESTLAPFVEHILAVKSYAGIEKSSYTDDSKVTDHYAIIPTGQVNGLNQLSSLQKSVFYLIARRFLAIFYPPAEYKTIKMQIKIDSELFYLSSKLLKTPGFMEVSGIQETKEQEDSLEGAGTAAKKKLIEAMEQLKAGDEISVNSFEVKEGKTSPPSRYTSGNLILAMENAGNLIEDEELREQIKKTGIGTSATRGEILEKLVRIGYLKQNNKTQVITPENLGEMIYEVVKLSVPTLLNPEMTASWEKGLEGISSGTVDVSKYRSMLEDYIRKETNKMIHSDLTDQIAANINQFTGKESKGLATRKKLGISCPVCGGELTTTAFGYGCSNFWNEKIGCKFSVGKIAGYQLEEQDFSDLITRGKTRVIDQFLGKNKKRFKAALKLEKDEKEEQHIVFDFSEVTADYLPDVKCPVCGGKITITSYGYTCENRMAETGSCYFSIGEIAGKHIEAETAIKLLTEGHTEVIKGFQSKKKIPFQAKLVLKPNEEGKMTIAFDFEGVEPDAIEGVVCPDCGGKIQIKPFGYGCSNYNGTEENSCRFAIGKIAQKALSVSQVQELLTSGTTKTIRGFKSKSGKRFDACLVLKKNESNKTEIGFDFENAEAKPVKDTFCPVCGGQMIKTAFGYGCSKYDKNDENSCRFSIGQIASVSLNEAQVKKLLQEKKTDKITGFRSKKGTNFDAVLKLDESNKIVFDFS